MSGNSANAYSQIIFSGEQRLDSESSTGTSYYMPRCMMFKRKRRGFQWWNLAMRVWSLHLFGRFPFRICHIRKWNVESPMSTWIFLVGSVYRTHHYTVSCISEALCMLISHYIWSVLLFQRLCLWLDVPHTALRNSYIRIFSGSCSENRYFECL
jgi:hypothetical protein